MIARAIRAAVMAALFEAVDAGDDLSAIQLRALARRADRPGRASRLVLAIALAVGLAVCGGWTRGDTLRELGYASATAMDWAQTRDITAACIETNLLILDDVESRAIANAKPANALAAALAIGAPVDADE